MFPYRISPATQNALERIELLRAGLDRRGPLPRLWLGRTRRDLEAEAVAASTRMEGVPVTVDEARRILAGDRPSSVGAQDAALVEGYRDAMRYVLARADDPHFAWHRELLLAVHHRVLAGSRIGGAGRLREGQNWVSNVQSGAQVYLPPAAADVPQLVSELMDWLQAYDGPTAVGSALAHVRLAAIHPFEDGNGRTARILASLVMYRAGFQAPQFTSLEEWWGRHVASYYTAFACLGASWDDSADVTDFVDAHVGAQASQVEALSLRQSVDHAVWTLLEDIARHDLRLDPRVTHALYDAFHARNITNRYYRGLAEVSTVTASHDLAKLSTAGMLEPRGAGRSSHYLGTPKLMTTLAGAAELPSGLVDPAASLEEQRDALRIGLGHRLHGHGSEGPEAAS